MIRHCVMFRWNDDVSAETKAAVAAGLDELTNLDAVHAYHHGPDLGMRDDNWDYMVVGDFLSGDDYTSYATEAGHVELITTLIAPNISARAAVQYEIAG